MLHFPKQDSETVSLDLLTFADLEALREKKAGAGTKTIPGASRSSTSLTTKRYLILTYSVEFDRLALKIDWCPLH